MYVLVAFSTQAMCKPRHSLLQNIFIKRNPATIKHWLPISPSPSPQQPLICPPILGISWKQNHTIGAFFVWQFLSSYTTQKFYSQIHTQKNWHRCSNKNFNVNIHHYSQCQKVETTLVPMHTKKWPRKTTKCWYGPSHGSTVSST